VEEKPGAQTDDGWDWMQVPATFVDYYSLDVMARAGYVRLAFAEYTSKSSPPIYRIGLVMPISDAKVLARQLARMIREAEARMAAEAPLSSKEIPPPDEA
jgi:hypothetical protein